MVTTNIEYKTHAYQLPAYCPVEPFSVPRTCLLVLFLFF